MTITGTIDEVQRLFKEYSELLKHTISVPDSISVNLSLYAQSRQLLVLDRKSLLEVSANSLGPTHSIDDICIIEKDVFDRLCKNKLKYPDHASCTSSENSSDISYLNRPAVMGTYNLTVGPERAQAKTNHGSAQTPARKTKTKGEFAKTAPRLSPTVPIVEEYPQLITLNEDYRIEDLQEHSFRREEHCAFGMKLLDENYFCLYYRNSVYDKGSDTTFRHYLLKQPGELIAYMYFKELSSLRFLFETNGRKLRHNGSNILSRSQADQIVHHFSYCF